MTIIAIQLGLLFALILKIFLNYKNGEYNYPKELKKEHIKNLKINISEVKNPIVKK